MTHDPMCDYAPDLGIYCSCPMIIMVRADERGRIIATHKPEESTLVAVLDERGEFVPVAQDHTDTSCVICNSQHPCRTVIALRLDTLAGD